MQRQTNAFEKSAFRRVASDEHRPRLASFEQPRQRIQAKFGLGFFRAMARHALLPQDRLDDVSKGLHLGDAFDFVLRWPLAK